MHWRPSAFAERAANEAQRAARQQHREKNQPRVKALNIVGKFHRDRLWTEIHMRLLWERLQSAKKRAGAIEEPYRSYDDMMVWAKQGSSSSISKKGRLA